MRICKSLEQWYVLSDSFTSHHFLTGEIIPSAFQHARAMAALERVSQVAALAQSGGGENPPLEVSEAEEQARRNQPLAHLIDEEYANWTIEVNVDKSYRQTPVEVLRSNSRASSRIILIMLLPPRS
jgi:hypothetical protein